MKITKRPTRIRNRVVDALAKLGGPDGFHEVDSEAFAQQVTHDLRRVDSVNKEARDNVTSLIQEAKKEDEK